MFYDIDTQSDSVTNMIKYHVFSSIVCEGQDSHLNILYGNEQSLIAFLRFCLFLVFNRFLKIGAQNCQS